MKLKNTGFCYESRIFLKRVYSHLRGRFSVIIDLHCHQRAACAALLPFHTLDTAAEVERIAYRNRQVLAVAAAVRCRIIPIQWRLQIVLASQLVERHQAVQRHVKVLAAVCSLKSVIRREAAVRQRHVVHAL